jgi:hypothetical protein
VNAEHAFRLAAVLAAVAFAVAPQWPAIKAAATRGLEAAKERAGLLSRLAAIALLLAAAWGKVPLPTLPAVAPSVHVDTPSDAMQRLVTPIADAMKGMPMGDRMLWADAWTKAGIVVAGDAVTTQVAFTDTRSLQAFTALALDIAWRRIGRHQPGSNETLRMAVETAYAAHLGKDVVPVTPELRARYVELADAIAWAGLNGG